MRAVGGLPQVGGHEFVTVDLMDPSAEGALTLPGTHPLAKDARLIVAAGRRRYAKNHKKGSHFFPSLLREKKQLQF